MSDYDTTEKVERTDKGFRLTVESTRGTGPRDQDTVKAQLRTEKIPNASQVRKLRTYAETEMEVRRKHLTGEEEDEE